MYENKKDCCNGKKIAILNKYTNKKYINGKIKLPFFEK